jgi:hypothetical protein
MHIQFYSDKHGVSNIEREVIIIVKWTVHEGFGMLRNQTETIIKSWCQVIIHAGIILHHPEFFSITIEASKAINE